MKLKDLEVGKYFKFNKHGFSVYEKTGEKSYIPTNSIVEKNIELVANKDELNKEVYDI